MSCFLESSAPTAGKGKKRAVKRDITKPPGPLPEVIVLLPEFAGEDQQRSIDAMKVWASYTQVHHARIAWLQALSRFDASIPDPIAARREASGEAEAERQATAAREEAERQRAKEPEATAQDEDRPAPTAPEEPQPQREPDPVPMDDDSERSRIHFAPDEAAALLPKTGHIEPAEPEAEE